jgi:N-acetylglucosamine-6-phosphate deacetylase
MKAIVNAKFVVDDGLIEDHVLLYDEKIIGFRETLPEGVEILDAKGAYVSAGFIDLHIHGSGGVDVMDATPEALERLSTTLLETGITSFLATTMTMSTEKIDNALLNIQQHGARVSGAEILGAHLEGPFINPAKHGAQDKTYVQQANFELIKNYMDEIKMITLAPEVAGSETFIKMLQNNYPHIVLSIGHSDATYEESRESFTWGISHATHLFNAMNVYHHRKPGIVGAVFDSDVSCDVIPDLIHTHASALELVQKVKKEKLIVITDAMRAGCMKSGMYDLGGQRVEVSGNKAVLEDGTLAGSVLKMNEALRNMQSVTSMTFFDIIKSVTKYPAQKLGVKKGELKEGFDADMAVFHENFSMIMAIVGGERKY